MLDIFQKLPFCCGDAGIKSLLLPTVIFLYYRLVTIYHIYAKMSNIHFIFLTVGIVLGRNIWYYSYLKEILGVALGAMPGRRHK